jgi:hypothetical protein
MRVASRVLIVLGLVINIAGSLATFYGVRTAVRGMMNAESSGIASVAWGMTSASSWSAVSLLGCFILIVGLILAALRSPAKAAAVAK